MAETHPLLSKFERALVLTESERLAIMLLPVQMETVRADQAILREGARPTRSCHLVEGQACSSKVGPNGKRQILAFFIPEDTPDLTSLRLELRDSDIWALNDCILAYVTHRDLDQLCDEQPRLAKFLWRSTLVDAAIHREWTLNVGLREGLSRLAHLLCEMMVRMEFIDRAKDGSCYLGLTQEDLSEATGLSEVHLNRMLQDLRRRKLISFAKGTLTVHDMGRLAELGDFRTDYLHLLRAKAA
jgi:CRP-like cAMP-binding protein